MKKKMIIGIIIVLLIIAAGAGYFWMMMNQATYQPGSIRSSDYLESSLTPPNQDVDSDFWQMTDDIKLHHFSSGKGRNVLIIHGGPGYPFLESVKALQSLEAQYQFHYYDQRGCGESTRPIESFSSRNYYENTQVLERRLGLTAQIADIERIRQILGEERLIIIGHSFGGFLASLYAAEFPEHVDGLVLIAPASLLVMPSDEDDLFDSIADNLSDDLLDEYNSFIEEYFNFKDIFDKSETDLVYLQNELGRYYQLAVGDESPIPQGDAGGWMVWAMYFSMGQRHDYREYLNIVSVPVLVLHGSDDLQSEEASRLYADNFPQAQLEVINNASHFVFEDQPDQFASIVEAFLRKIP
jgi:proline iminopeptidase